MILIEDAKLRAAQHIEFIEQSCGEQLEIIDVNEIRNGWVFFYQSRRYLETHQMSHILAGNAPFVVNKLSGLISTFGTAHPLEYYIEQYDK